ncbi:MAG: hypothetical protein CMK07_10105 [Ponticaulis sp.]|nr:hypothetical protein [Ponticaulis sp.]
MKPVFLVAAIVAVGGIGLAVNYLKPSTSEASVKPERISELRTRLPLDGADGFSPEPGLEDDAIEPLASVSE